MRRILDINKLKVGDWVMQKSRGDKRTYYIFLKNRDKDGDFNGDFNTTEFVTEKKEWRELGLAKEDFADSWKVYKLNKKEGQKWNEKLFLEQI